MALTRRQVLATTAAAALGWSGCLGDSGEASSSPGVSASGTSPPRADPDALSAPFRGSGESAIDDRRDG